MNIYEKLNAVQGELKAPKNQYNNFGKYSYRNCEDILEAVKPLLIKHKLNQTISDKIIEVGGRVYVEAKVMLVDTEKTEDVIITTALARESEKRKGMDESQITGATSSYARKYCLSGLYAIDDNKDADTMKPENKKAKKEITIGADNFKDLKAFCDRQSIDGKDKQKLLDHYKVDLYSTTATDFNNIFEKMRIDHGEDITDN